MAKFRSNQLWETRQAVMQVVAAAILVMTITGGVVSWGVARAGDLKDAVEGLEKVTDTNTGKFPGTRKIFGSIEGSPDVSHANSPQLRAPSVRIRFGELVKSDQTAPTFSLTASAVSKTWLAKWRDFRNWNTVSTGFSSGL